MGFFKLFLFVYLLESTLQVFLYLANLLYARKKMKYQIFLKM